MAFLAGPPDWGGGAVVRWQAAQPKISAPSSTPLMYEATFPAIDAYAYYPMGMTATAPPPANGAQHAREEEEAETKPQVHCC